MEAGSCTPHAGVKNCLVKLPEGRIIIAVLHDFRASVRSCMKSSHLGASETAAPPLDRGRHEKPCQKSRLYISLAERHFPLCTEWREDSKGSGKSMPSRTSHQLVCGRVRLPYRHHRSRLIPNNNHQKVTHSTYTHFNAGPLGTYTSTSPATGAEVPPTALHHLMSETPPYGIRRGHPTIPRRTLGHAAGAANRST